MITLQILFLYKHDSLLPDIVMLFPLALLLLELLSLTFTEQKAILFDIW